MLDYVQTWQPDTCDCLVHQAGDQDLPVPWQQVRESGQMVTCLNTYMDMALNLKPKANQRIMRYVTYEEAQLIHLEHFRQRPKSTNCQVWWQAPSRSQLRRGKRPKPVIALVQPRPRLCPWHEHLGFTQEMYDTMDELNWRKSTACWLAWKLGNGVSDESLMWVSLGNTVPAPYKEAGTGRILMSTEREQRMASLVTVFPQTAVSWQVNQPGDHVELLYLRDWLPQEQADAIQSACDHKWRTGQVVVS